MEILASATHSDRWLSLFLDPVVLAHESFSNAYLPIHAYAFYLCYPLAMWPVTLDSRETVWPIAVGLLDFEIQGAILCSPRRISDPMKEGIWDVQILGVCMNLVSCFWSESDGGHHFWLDCSAASGLEFDCWGNPLEQHYDLNAGNYNWCGRGFLYPISHTDLMSAWACELPLSWWWCIL